MVVRKRTDWQVKKAYLLGFEVRGEGNKRRTSTIAKSFVAPASRAGPNFFSIGVNQVSDHFDGCFSPHGGDAELFSAFSLTAHCTCWLEDSTFHFAQFGHSLHPPRKVSDGSQTAKSPTDHSIFSLSSPDNATPTLHR